MGGVGGSENKCGRLIEGSGLCGLNVPIELTDSVDGWEVREYLVNGVELTVPPFVEDGENDGMEDLCIESLDCARER